MKKKKDSWIHTRVTNTEAQELRTAADGLGIDRSHLVRSALAEYLQKLPKKTEASLAA